MAFGVLDQQQLAFDEGETPRLGRGVGGGRDRGHETHRGIVPLRAMPDARTQEIGFDTGGSPSGRPPGPSMKVCQGLGTTWPTPGLP